MTESVIESEEIRLAIEDYNHRGIEVEELIERISAIECPACGNDVEVDTHNFKVDNYSLDADVSCISCSEYKVSIFAKTVDHIATVYTKMI